MGNNSKQFKWIFYCTVCTVNKKCYLGIHKTEKPYEFDSYIGGGWEIGTMIKNPTTAYENALKKYGYDKFIRVTLRVCDTLEEAKKLETLFVDLEFIKRRDTYNTQLGGCGGGIYKKFYQYDLNGNFIKEWFSREDLINEYHLENDVNRIHRAVVNKWSAFDSFWTEEKVDKLNLDEYRSSKFSAIYQFDSSGNEIAKYNTASEIAEKLNISINFANEAISKKIPAKGYFFTKTPSKIFDIIKTHQDKVSRMVDGCVSIYDLNGNIVKTFRTLTEVSRYISVTPKSIKQAINNASIINNYRIAYGFKETYSKNTTAGVQIDQFDLNNNFIKRWNTISECAKEHPKVRLVLSGVRQHTHGYTFKIVD